MGVSIPPRSLMDIADKRVSGGSWQFYTLQSTMEWQRGRIGLLLDKPELCYMTNHFLSFSRLRLAAQLYIFKTGVPVVSWGTWHLRSVFQARILRLAIFGYLVVWLTLMSLLRRGRSLIPLQREAYLWDMMKLWMPFAFIFHPRGRLLWSEKWDSRRSRL